MMLERGSIADRCAALRKEIDDTLRSLGRAPGSVRLVAVTKFQPRAAVVDAIAAGIDGVGENYVQEAEGKLAGLAVRKHFIGHLQTNKARRVAALFDVVESVDRVDAARALDRAAAALGRRLGVLLQVNVSPAERFGAAPEAFDDLLAEVRAMPNLRVDGVMAIGPVGVGRDELMGAFELARRCFERTGGTVLSLGMSGDWREALAAGSTEVRLGTALFGARPQRDADRRVGAAHRAASGGRIG
ncbi:MAG TPA: YggS family pyridoxal phosphate-dependent enzyme [Candidatus Dormibacteraeota bacterium]|nr:YggS family pyridoxal phosphate-dependent enzyme [Candidatus Dormibacteraeota bacterium]